jgi:hypothetical protein
MAKEKSHLEKTLDSDAKKGLGKAGDRVRKTRAGVKETIHEGWQAIADRIGVSVSTAKSYESKGLPVHQPGGERGRVFVTEGKLIEWLES